ncbi:uncharacterized protein LOC108291083 [Cebus imitator]|uniref:uncharacterized protein LOC108291083 n=1 Tax=Cebus imitator TaxID=2715852 RepID=UPI001899E3E8|nr:uncharacterized protein LOC108291083 [Cebus imitator]
MTLGQPGRAGTGFSHRLLTLCRWAALLLCRTGRKFRLWGALDLQKPVGGGQRTVTSQYSPPNRKIKAQNSLGPSPEDQALNQVQCYLPHCAMNPGLLCWTLLCLLGAVPVQAEVTQSPTHLIKTRGQQVTLRCSPISGHTSVSWYQQAPGFQFSDYHSEMNISTLELGDSALYLCASSLAQPCRVTATLCTNLSASVYGNLRSDSCENLGPSGAKKNNFRTLNKSGESKARRICSEDAAASGGSWQITFFAGSCTLQS